jgi:hypothetical protein
MELLALLFALFPIIATIIFWICKLGVRPSKNQESTLPTQEELAVAPVATTSVATPQAQTSTFNEDEIAVVLAAAANVYIRTIK